MSYFVQLLDERNRFQIFAAAKFVRHPLAFFAALIEIKHRSDCVDPQSVEMKLAQPEQRVCDKEIAHFVAAIVEDVSTPVGLLGSCRIEGFVKRRTVEAPPSKRVFGKIRRH